MEIQRQERPRSRGTTATMAAELELTTWSIPTASGLHGWFRWSLWPMLSCSWWSCSSTIVRRITTAIAATAWPSSSAASPSSPSVKTLFSAPLPLRKPSFPYLLVSSISSIDRVFCFPFNFCWGELLLVDFWFLILVEVEMCYVFNLLPFILIWDLFVIV